MFLRALLAFIALPGVVAFLLPALIASSLAASPHFSFIGASVSGIGVVALLWCVRDFYVTGKGTLAPWSPPRHLVTVGLYRFTRNPMYVAVLLILGGWALLFHSFALALYAGAIAMVFHLRVVLGEEPWLAQTHDVEWQAYQQAVSRWPWLSSRRCEAERDSTQPRNERHN
jgi:protein-S-isoprenylcysteine O-methyltransferase Ste14